MSLSSTTEQKKHDQETLKTHIEISHYYFMVQLPELTPPNRVSIYSTFSFKAFLFPCWLWNSKNHTLTLSPQRVLDKMLPFVPIWIAFIFLRDALWQRLHCDKDCPHGGLSVIARWTHQVFYVWLVMVCWICAGMRPSDLKTWFLCVEFLGSVSVPRWQYWFLFV